MDTEHRQNGGSDTRGPGPAQPTAPPAFFMSVMNGVMKALLRLPVRGGFTKHILLLSFQGRKSGKQYAIPVAYSLDGHTVTIFTRSPWWKNLQGGTPVILHLQGRDVQGTAETVSDPGAMAVGAQQYMTQNGVRGLKMIGFPLADGHAPGLDELARASVGKVMISITLNK